jgi:hypothetical protein
MNDQGAKAVRNRSRKAAFAFGTLLACAAAADTTSISVGNAVVTAGTAGTTTTMNFPFTRSGDLSYGVVVDYQVQTGPATNSVASDPAPQYDPFVIPAGSSTATAPVSVSGKTGGGPDKQFTLKLLDAFAPAPSFGAAGSLSVNNPGPIAVADFNGDGKSDLAVISNGNSSSSAVEILISTTAAGAGAASFGPALSVPLASASAIVAGDFDGDGKPDLAVSTGNSITILRNTTVPGSTMPVFTAVATIPLNAAGFLAVGDFNGDGRLDLAAVNGSNTSVVSILLNTTAPGATTPSFAAAVNVADGICIAVADFNGDGSPDLALCTMTGSGLQILLNTTAHGATTPSFGPSHNLSNNTDGAYQALAVGDFNGDGKPDLAGSSFSILLPYLDTTLSVFVNTTPPGSMTPSFNPNFVTLGSVTMNFVVADFNGDGKPDLAAQTTAGIGSRGPTNFVMLNDTPPGADVSKFIQLPISDCACDAAGDFNGDGKPDLVGVQSYPANVWTLLNTTIPGTAPYQVSLSSTPGIGTIRYAGAPALKFSSTSVQFPAQSVGSTSTPTTITVTNLSGTTVDFFGIAPSGQFGADFPLSGYTCDLQGLKPGQSCTVQVEFQPHADGLRSAVLYVESTAAYNPAITLSGTGINGTPTVSLTPTLAKFSAQAVGSTSAASADIILSNSGSAPLTLSGQTVSGDFLLNSSGCPSHIGVGERCTIKVQFHPTATGTRSGALKITSNGTGSPNTMSLSGIGR